MTKPKADKTYKRELAVILLLWFGYLVETKDESLLEILVWPVFTYSALAFGLDWSSKSGPLRGVRDRREPIEPPDGFPRD